MLSLSLIEHSITAGAPDAPWPSGDKFIVYE